jgi:hypothetical protein
MLFRMAIPPVGDPGLSQTQVELLRAAGPTVRAGRALALSASVIDLSRNAIRRRHPHWSETEVRLAFAALHYGGEVAARVRAELERRLR